MKVKFTRNFPLGRYKAISLFGVMLYKDKDGSKRDFMERYPTLYYRMVEHERIHWEQQKEMLVIPFFLWYAVEYMVKCLFYRDPYKNLGFEREAREGEVAVDKYDVYSCRDSDGKVCGMEYVPHHLKGGVENRRHFAWIKMVFKK